MKTNKTQAAKTVPAKMPKEVIRYEQAAKKLRTVMDEVCKLSDIPSVAEYLKTRKAAKLAFVDEPKLTEQEKRQKELDYIYDKFFRNWHFLIDYLHILVDLSRNSEEVTIDELEGMLNEINKRIWPIRAITARAFQLLGVVKDDEMSAEAIESAVKEDYAFD